MIWKTSATRCSHFSWCDGICVGCIALPLRQHRTDGRGVWYTCKDGVPTPTPTLLNTPVPIRMDGTGFAKPSAAAHLIL